MEDKKISYSNIKMKDLLLVLFGGIIGAIIGSAVIYTLLKQNLSNEVQIYSDNNASTTKYQIETVDNPVIAIAENVGPSVVGIKVTYMTRTSYGIYDDAGSEGSGIIYSSDGYIITNYHVIEEAISNSSAVITVTLPKNKEEVEATIVGTDEYTDIAVLKIEKTGLTKAIFGDSTNVKVGEIAVAIGNPLGQQLAGTVTGGYISAVNRDVTVSGKTFNLVQTDAAINPGNSGGPLVNSKGEVIGINTVKISSTNGVEGLGFAIPSNEAIPIIEELIENKKIVRPYIGIAGYNLEESLAKRYDLVAGVYVTEVEKGSPAYKAGIKASDVVIGIDSEDITTIEELNSIKNTKKVGDTIKLKIYRSGKEIEIDLILAEDE